MQLTSIALFLSAAVSVSALPATLQARQAAAGAHSTTGPKSAKVACDRSSKSISRQIAEMSKLMASNISVPPYLAGYYTAIDDERQEIGCPGAVSLGKREFTPNKEPCDVNNGQNERMTALVIRFEADQIAVAPFVAGFMSAVLDEHKGLGCPPFTGPGSEAAAARIAGASNSTISDSDSS
ncbi:hypothetical protein HO133_006222 [Letharia lupina]|uniref:Uncharacterized protein n=1 Tax=Letharia lupina TaxID=560253 RepID=A0A8H6C7G9_9LECA|nr:uncharacterized protein HO133_006222 [Letharia lupina]KAF6218260.1 hypothetical protein HO133_006222 [Letharia lupina]